MKLPEKLMVFGQVVKVRYAKLKKANGLSHESGLIEISEDLAPSKVKQILIHEFLHSVIYRLSLDGTLSLELEEILVDNISKCLCENFDIRVKKRK